MKLFTSATLGKTTLSNRIVMAPMTRSRALGNVPSDLMALYYGQRAEAGLIITEGTSPSPNGLGYPRIPGIFNAEQARGMGTGDYRGSRKKRQDFPADHAYRARLASRQHARRFNGYGSIRRAAFWPNIHGQPGPAGLPGSE